MTRDRQTSSRSPDERHERDTKRLEAVVASYVDRLVAGDTFSPEQILAEQPEFGEEILVHLGNFADLDAASFTCAPLGTLGTLGDYTLSRRIGRGGMGVVYDAWQNSVDRRVALKVLPPGVAADERTLQRFVREAKTAGQLNHRNIVGVYSTGVEEGTPWYSMEYVDGQTLAQVLAQINSSDGYAETPFGRKGELAFFSNLGSACADVADGLQHAHAKGVVHRDIKPSNLILDQEGRLRILDFGLAHLEGQDSLTISGDVVGTPLYMSPEQARRRKTPVDHRTDVYSLGATMYEAFCGRPPFKGRNNQETLSQIIEQEPIPPSRLHQRMPRDLETIVLKCLRKDPGDRYGTAEALAQDLRRFVRGEPIEARPQTGWSRFAFRVHVHRRALAVAGTILALLVTSGWTAFRRAEADRAAKVAAYRPAVIEVLRQIHATQMSAKVLVDERGRYSSLLDRATSIVTPDELRDMFAKPAGSELRRATSSLKAIAAALPQKPDAYYHLAKAYVLLEEKDRAAETAASALKCDPDFVPARVLLLELEGLHPHTKPFAELFAEYGSSSGWRRPWLTAHRGAQIGGWRDVVSAWGQIVDLGPDGEPYVGAFIEGHLERGMARVQLGDFISSIEDFSVVCSEMPGPEFKVLLAIAHRLTDIPGHRARALAILVDLYHQATDGEKAEAAFWNAIACGFDVERGAAVDWLRRVDVPELRERLELYCLWREGKTEDAIVAGRRLLAQDPEDGIARRILASALLRDYLSQPLAHGERSKELMALAAELERDSPLAEGLLDAARQLSAGSEQKGESSMKAANRTIWVPVAAALFAGTASAREGLLGGYFDDVDALPAHLHWAAETQPSISADGLELYFAGFEGGGLDSVNILVARRADRGAPWGPAEPLAELRHLTQVYAPFIMPDGKTLYFSQTFDWAANGIWVASRESIGAPYPAPRVPFSNPRRLTEIRGRDPSLTADGLELYYVHTPSGSSTGCDIFVATRSEPTGPFEHFSALGEVNSPYAEDSPCVSADGLTLFWSDLGSWYPEALKPGCHGNGDIWFATRERRFDDDGNRVPFGPPQCLAPPVNSPVNDRGPGLSWDWPQAGSKLYFYRFGPSRDVLAEMWEATWHLDCDGDGVDDSEEIARGEEADRNGNGIPDACEGLTGDVAFLRGDANDDGGVDVSDAQFILNWLFLGESAPGCVVATNANGDDSADISDSVYLLGHLFLGGPPPGTPYPECGPVPDEEGLTCEVPPASCQ